MTNINLPWISVDEIKPDSHRKSKKRYMVYHPMYGGYVFRCWYDSSYGFGCDDCQAMISDVTHYRPAGKTEKSRQLSTDELLKINMIGPPVEVKRWCTAFCEN